MKVRKSDIADEFKAQMHGVYPGMDLMAELKKRKALGILK